MIEKKQYRKTRIVGKKYWNLNQYNFDQTVTWIWYWRVFQDMESSSLKGLKWLWIKLQQKLKWKAFDSIRQTKQKEILFLKDFFFHASLSFLAFCLLVDGKLTRENILWELNRNVGHEFKSMVGSCKRLQKWHPIPSSLAFNNEV